MKARAIEKTKFGDITVPQDYLLTQQQYAAVGPRLDASLPCWGSEGSPVFSRWNPWDWRRSDLQEQYGVRKLERQERIALCITRSDTGGTALKWMPEWLFVPQMVKKTDWFVDITALQRSLKTKPLQEPEF